MAVSNLVAASSGKTRYLTTLKSGTSWSVPSGVNYVVVHLLGGGGGASAAGNANPGSAGGTTTFATNINAAGGAAGGGGGMSGYTYGDGASALANTGQGGMPLSSASGNTGFTADFGAAGSETVANVSVTSGGNVSYSIGAGGSGGSGYPGGYNNSQGTYNASGAGGSGKIDIEYWL